MQEIVVDYTLDNCRPSNATISSNYTTCASYLQENIGRICECVVEFTLTKDFLVSTTGQKSGIEVIGLRI